MLLVLFISGLLFIFSDTAYLLPQIQFLYCHNFAIVAHTSPVLAQFWKTLLEAVVDHYGSLLGQLWQTVLAQCCTKVQARIRPLGYWASAGPFLQCLLGHYGSILGQFWQTVLAQCHANVQYGIGSLLVTVTGSFPLQLLCQH